jgi:alpha-tubulin suppressor-like RCC1 family protein
MTFFDNWNGAIKKTDRLPGKTLLDSASAGPKRIPCGRMFTLQLLSDGQIRQCGCRVDNFAEKDELIIGHIDNMTLAEAFNSKAARNSIASFISGKHLNVCRTCTWYSPEI